MRTTRILAAVLLSALCLPATVAAHTPGTGARASLLPTPGLAKNLELLDTEPLGAAISGEFAHTGSYFYVSLLNGVAVLDTANPANPQVRGVLPQLEFENEAMTYGERPIARDAAHPDGLQRFVIVGNDLVNATIGVPQAGSLAAPGVQRGRIGGGEAIVVDVSNPANPFVAGRSPATSTTPGVITTSTHTLQCASLSCEYAYTAGDGEEFSIVDLRDLTKPRQVKTIRSAAAGPNPAGISDSGHYWDADYASKVAWHTGSGGAEVFNVADPLNPRPLNGTNAQGTQSPYNDFILHNSMRPNGRAFRAGAAPALNRGNVLLVTEEDYVNDGDEVACDRAGTFQSWGVPDLDGGRFAAANPDQKTPGKGTIGVLDTISAPLESGAVLNTPAGGFCSAHWFDYHQNGVVAQGFYQQGLHLIDVSDPRNLKSYGYFTATASEVWDAYFVPERDANGVATGRKTDIVYTADAVRGVDVLRAALPAAEIVPDLAGADGSVSGVNAQPAKAGDSNLGPNGTATKPAAGAGARRCGSRRLFTIRLKEPRRGRGRLRSARVTLDGRRLKVTRRRGRLTARIDLRTKAATTVKVRIVARTSRGRTLRSTRTYRTCAKKAARP